MRLRRKTKAGKTKAERAVPGAIGGLLRLSRNLAGEKFPFWASDTERERVKEKIVQAAKDVDSTAFFIPLDEMDSAMVPAFEDAGAPPPSSGGFVFFGGAPDTRIAVNTANHLEIECACDGIDLMAMWPRLDELDDRLSERLDYAWSPRLGYLTVSSTNTGTALLAETLVQLPGFHLLGETSAVTNALDRLDYRVRGIDSPECPFPAALYRISNRITIGKTETELIDDVTRVTAKLLMREWQARRRVLSDTSVFLMLDYVARALSAAQGAFLIPQQECIQLLFILRFGIETGAVKGISLKEVEDLLHAAQKAGYVLERFADECDDADIRQDRAYADFLNLSLRNVHLDVATDGY